LIYTVWELA